MGKQDQSQLLGEVSFTLMTFPDLENLLKPFQSKAFKQENAFEKQQQISKLLYSCIDKQQAPCFLLAALVDFISHIRDLHISSDYSFAQFELWLNNHEEISIDKQLQIRGKIVGKYIPRSEYQCTFPIGMDKVYSGSHIVTAHASPDLDTTIATFWGWMDAFAARVSDGLHVWNVPDQPPHQVETSMLFSDIFGKQTFDILAKKRKALTLTGLDLVSMQGVYKRKPHEKSYDLQVERKKTATILINDKGYYLGDWRPFDVEGVRQVINMFYTCLRWIEHELYVALTVIFSKEHLQQKIIEDAINEVLSQTFISCEPVKDATLRQQQLLQGFLENVIGLASGLDSSFEEFIAALDGSSEVDFSSFKEALDDLKTSSLFDESGKFIENRPLIFSLLQRVVVSFANFFLELRDYLDSLQVALKVKEQVYGFSPQYISQKADIEEIRMKMDSYPYLTVNYSDQDKGYLPLGVIFANDLQKPKLGTVTLRDFSNREETKIPEFLEVISVIDHHKLSLTTQAPPQAIIADAQSSNVIVANMSFMMNDGYSLGGILPEHIQSQLSELRQSLDSKQNMRIFKRLLNRKLVQTNEHYFVAKEREFYEYLHYLYGIFDDTDLLTKLSVMDVQCVASLLNRLKSIQLGYEIEIIHFDDIALNHDFVQKASQRLLQNKDLHSLYSKVYSSKEKLLTQSFEKCANGESEAIFSDTKTLNALARIGQTKIFAKNFAHFEKYRELLQKAWLSKSKQLNEQHLEIDLYMHMISTVASAEELFAGSKLQYAHQDELWIWVGNTEIAYEHLKLFLNAFQSCPNINKEHMSVQFYGDNAEELKDAFKQCFLSVPLEFVETKEKLPIAVLKFEAGSLNSRKSMIAPYLPRLKA